jgi:hypothetical protein
MRQALREGIPFELVRTWQDVDRNFERKLKRRKASGRLCTVCRAARAPTRLLGLRVMLGVA